MKKLLIIQSSPNGANSISRIVGEGLVQKIKNLQKNQIEIRTRDLNLSPVPHLNGTSIQAFFTPLENRTPELNIASELSDQLTHELLWADEIVLEIPMWNFGVPSVMKAWIDHISRAGLTFSYGPEGLKGLAGGRKVYLVIASGSIFSKGPYASYDQVVPYLKTFFGFIGITEVEVIRAEGVNDPANKDKVITNAIAYIDQIIN